MRMSFNKLHQTWVSSYTKRLFCIASRWKYPQFVLKMSDSVNLQWRISQTFSCVCIPARSSGEMKFLELPFCPALDHLISYVRLGRGDKLVRCLFDLYTGSNFHWTNSFSSISSIFTPYLLQLPVFIRIKED